MMKPDRKFECKLKFIIDESHPLYEDDDRCIRGQLGMFIMNCFSDGDPSLGYECEFIERNV